MEHYLHQYGYFAVFAGTILEGGTLLTMAGFAAHQGYLKMLPWVILAGFVGNFVDTLIFYYIGRLSGTAYVEKHPTWRPRLETMHSWLERYRSPVIVGVRFVPTLRTVGAVAIGIAKVPLGQFLFLNAVGALLWASTVGYAGYLFGHLLKVIMGDLKQYELPVLSGILILGSLAFLLGRRFLRTPSTRS